MNHFVHLRLATLFVHNWRCIEELTYCDHHLRLVAGSLEVEVAVRPLPESFPATGWFEV